MSVKAFDGVFEMPVQGRTVKPRKNGITMLIDKGLGLSGTQDLMEMASDAIDMVKMTFGTTAFMDMDVVEQKIEILKNYDVYTMPGGTFMEVALWQRRYPEYLRRCKDLGFNAIEISDGTIEFDLETRKDSIKQAVDMGFLVLTEVGKKDPNEKVAADMRATYVGRVDGRQMPSFFIRCCRVERFIPRRAAAPCLPAITQLVCPSVSMIWERSASASVRTEVPVRPS